MLFDLRGRGRRNTVRVIYASLALLMGGGLVLFGIGSDVGGIFSNAGQGGNESVDDTFEKRIEQFEKRTRANPRDAQAWAELARAHFQQAGIGDNYDQATAAYTESGQQKLRQASEAWDRYLALDPTPPDADIANVMVQAFGPAGLNDLEKAVAAMEIVVEQREESAALYGQLAQLAYLAGQTRKGDLSAKKAVELAPEDQRAQLKQTLEQVKAQAATQAAQEAITVPPTTTTPPAQTTTTG